jgi:hypothetical protein
MQKTYVTTHEYNGSVRTIRWLNDESLTVRYSLKNKYPKLFTDEYGFDAEAGR